MATVTDYLIDAQCALRKSAGNSEERAGHKYTRREWNHEKQRYDYQYGPATTAAPSPADPTSRVTVHRATFGYTKSGMAYMHPAQYSDDMKEYMRRIDGKWRTIDSKDGYVFGVHHMHDAQEKAREYYPNPDDPASATPQNMVHRLNHHLSRGNAVHVQFGKNDPMLVAGVRLNTKTNRVEVTTNGDRWYNAPDDALTRWQRDLPLYDDDPVSEATILDADVSPLHRNEHQDSAQSWLVYHQAKAAGDPVIRAAHADSIAKIGEHLQAASRSINAHAKLHHILRAGDHLDAVVGVEPGTHRREILRHDPSQKAENHARAAALRDEITERMTALYPDETERKNAMRTLNGGPELPHVRGGTIHPVATVKIQHLEKIRAALVQRADEQRNTTTIQIPESSNMETGKATTPDNAQRGTTAAHPTPATPAPIAATGKAPAKAEDILTAKVSKHELRDHHQSADSWAFNELQRLVQDPVARVKHIAQIRELQQHMRRGDYHEDQRMDVRRERLGHLANAADVLDQIHGREPGTSRAALLNHDPQAKQAAYDEYLKVNEAFNDRVFDDWKYRPEYEPHAGAMHEMGVTHANRGMAVIATHQRIGNIQARMAYLDRVDAGEIGAPQDTTPAAPAEPAKRKAPVFGQPAPQAAHTPGSVLDGIQRRMDDQKVQNAASPAPARATPSGPPSILDASQPLEQFELEDHHKSAHWMVNDDITNATRDPLLGMKYRKEIQQAKAHVQNADPRRGNQTDNERRAAIGRLADAADLMDTVHGRAVGSTRAGMLNNDKAQKKALYAELDDLNKQMYNIHGVGIPRQEIDHVRQQMQKHGPVNAMEFSTVPHLQQSVERARAAVKTMHDMAADYKARGVVDQKIVTPQIMPAKPAKPARPQFGQAAPKVQRQKAAPAPAHEVEQPQPAKQQLLFGQKAPKVQRPKGKQPALVIAQQNKLELSRRRKR